MTSVVGVDPTWEQIRAQHINLYYNALHRYHRKRKFEPGQIASCDGSIEVAFWLSLIDMGVKIDSSEMPINMKKPKRFCVVNRHVAGQAYEVFLLTTFGGAKNFEELGVLGSNFGFPMGGTKWFNNTPGLATIPPVFGSDKTSFVFAIPVIEVISPSNVPVATRLPPVELDRLRNFSKMLAEKHREIRRTLRSWRNNKMQSGRTSSELQDKFKPAPRRVPISLEDHDDMQDFIADSTAISSRFKPPYIDLPPRNDISWILRHTWKDYNVSKSLIQRPPVKLRRFSLPKPHYAPLPIAVKKVLQSIR
ncbi:hypothetical protein CVT25_015233 [Psilocybe cyanescens]|uniref:Uncharacterized protein n=1 Tax=Psilocybe cyanescens TaxID=93625 RepID=A0A409XR14_PSICY|nr:hypothetical protein CVT25_015233 [Psilocybe cyanescens]